MLGFFKDFCNPVSRIEEISREVQNREADILNALQIAGIMIWEWNSETQVFRWLGPSQDISEFQSCITTDPIGLYFSTIHSEDRESLFESAREAFQSSNVFRDEYRITNKNQNMSYIELTILASKDKQGRISRYIGVVRDATESMKPREEIESLNKNLEQIVQKNKQELKEINEHLERALEKLNKTQNQLILSEKMASLGQLIARIAHEINNPIGTIQASLELIRSQKNPLFWEYQKSNLMQSLNGELKSIAEDFFLYAMQLRDIPTGIKRRDIKNAILQELEPYPLSSKTYFAERCIDIGIQTFPDKYKDLLSHSLAEEILEYLLDRIFSEKNLEAIEISVQRVANLIKSLKNYSHIESSREKIPYSVEESLETVLMMFYNNFKRGIELVRNYEDVPMILCNPDDLAQLWTNLIENALHAMENKGTLELRIYKTLQPAQVNVEVIDSGKGIPESIIDRIFEPFFTTKRLGEGSGLGLDISKKIVADHNGKIYCQSRPGRTVFHVVFPVVHENADSSR